MPRLNGGIIDNADSFDTKALCYRMFLTQPPVTKVKISMVGLCRYPEWEDRRGLPKFYEGEVAMQIVENEDGVTFQHFISAIGAASYKAVRGRARPRGTMYFGGYAVGEMEKVSMGLKEV